MRTYMISTFTKPIIAFALIIFNLSATVQFSLWPTNNSLFYATAIAKPLQQVKLQTHNYGIHKTTHLKKPDAVISTYHRRYSHIDPKTGLRTSHYRAALPDTVPGGTRITLKEAYQHYKNKTALFLDVMAHTGAGPSPLDGHWQLSEVRKNIPDSIWLPDVGTGTLTQDMAHYFKSNLQALSADNKQKPIIIYCTADCWMAWNAVQRAAHWGYKNILWFPEGTDDWHQAGYPLKKATPVPLKITD